MSFFRPHINEFFKSQAMFLLFKPAKVHFVRALLIPIRTNLVAHFEQIVGDFDLICRKSPLKVYYGLVPQKFTLALKPTIDILHRSLLVSK